MPIPGSCTRYAVRNQVRHRIRQLEKEERQLQGKGKSTFRVILTILTGTTGIVLFGYIFLMFQSRMTLLSLQEEMIENSSYICDAYSKYERIGFTRHIFV